MKNIYFIFNENGVIDRTLKSIKLFKENKMKCYLFQAILYFYL